jgi:hypothetical protein
MVSYQRMPLIDPVQSFTSVRSRQIIAYIATVVIECTPHPSAAQFHASPPGDILT